MSKSKGNFFTARDLFAKGIEPAALRLELIKTHYRSNANFTMQGLADSQRMVERWRRIAGDFSSRRDGGGALTPVLRDVAGALHDDLNIAEAVAAINAWAGSVELGPITAATMSMLDGVLGVLSLERPQAQQTAIGVFNGVAPSPEVEALLAQRRDARARKDFKASDAIRDQLAGMGYAIKDLPGGKVEVRRA